MTDVASRAHDGSARTRWVETCGLTLLAYVPFLLSSPGRLSSDTKQYLYLDPGRFLARALWLWDPHVAAGTVPHQQIGYLFPMGPYYWLMDRVGVPDWVAQRLWLGTISFAAVLGARWLFTVLGTRRVGALVGALVYMLTPYQLAFTARMSVLLLPWAGLPWLVGLTMRATRRGGWRDPALFALVALAVGGVNASALVLVGIAPALWVVLELCAGRERARAALGAATRIAVLTVGVSLWWAVGLWIQGSYGLPILQLTENVRTVSKASSPDDVMRGIGNWFFYGHDQLGYSVEQALDYAQGHLVSVGSFALVATGLLAAAGLRWQHRAYFALLVIVGTILGVGAWPYDDPTPYGRVWKAFASGSSLGLALRNTPRVVPVLVLGFAGLLAAAVGAIASRRVQVVAALAVVAFAFAALLPVWQVGYLTTGVERPNDVPAYWEDAAVALQREGSATRVLEIPGSSFATYRWGNAVEPITPGLMDRPYLAREVLPYGTPQSVNLLDAFDRRLQNGTFEPASLAPIARLFGVGTVVVRSDLAYERYGAPRPRLVWRELTDPLAPGLHAPRSFGPVVRNTPPWGTTTLDALDLRTPTDAADPPPVALFDVTHAVPIIHAAPTAQPVVLSGDGDGIVDAAAAGLLNGDEQLLGLAALDDAALRHALRAHADLLLTDSNRRRIQSWFSSLRDTKGATERAGQTTRDPAGNDARLEVFPGSTDASRTVVEQHDARVDATADGGATRPEDRPVYAFDGDLRTSWRVGGADPTGERIVVRPDHPIRTDRVTLVQPLDGPRDRWLTEVRLHFDPGAPVDVTLGPESFTPAGQVVRFPARTIRRLGIELRATHAPPFDPALANSVGFAEVRLGTLRATETVRLPIDLAERVGGRARGHRLAIVMSRLRQDPSAEGRRDDELALNRRLVLPDGRAFTLSGTARVHPNVPDDLLDSTLGTVASGVRFSASGHLAGDLDARASRAFDHDPSTAWSSPMGPQESQLLDVELPAPVTVDHVDLTIVADGRHSVPTRVHLEADGARTPTLAVPAIADTPREGAVRQATLRFAPISGRHLRVVVDGTRRETPTQPGVVPARIPPVAIAEVGLNGVPVPEAPDGVPAACHADLLEVDGRAVPVRLIGGSVDARRGIAIEACAGPLVLRAGSHRLAARPGLDTGIEIDRVVLGSDATGEAAAVTPLGARLGTSGTTIQVAKSHPTAVNLKVRTDGRSFWLVFGQSRSDGWRATTATGSVGRLQTVDGYANGWLIHPARAGTMKVSLEWTPQRVVWVGLGLSGLAALVCVGIVAIATRRRRGRVVLDGGPALTSAPLLVSPLAYPAGPPVAWATTAVLVGSATLLTAAVSRQWIGLAAGAAALVAARLSPTRFLLTITAPVVLVLSRMAHTPELAWLALALLAIDVTCGWLRERLRC